MVRTAVPLLRAVDPHQREVAAVLGASPRRVWREIDLRVITRAAAVAAGFAFAISLGEFGVELADSVHRQEHNAARRAVAVVL